MGLKLITPPAEEPVGVGDLRSHLRKTGSDEDILIAAAIVAARQYFEDYTSRQLITATWEETLDFFPTGRRRVWTKSGWVWEENVIELSKPPLQAPLVSLKYIDPDGVEQTLATTEYEVDTTVEPGQVRLAYNKSWPSIRRQKDAIRIQFKAGYGGAVAVPEMHKAAIKLHVGHLFENRELSADTKIELIDFTWKHLAQMARWSMEVA